MAFDGTYGSPEREEQEQEQGHELDQDLKKGEWRWVDDDEAKRAKLGVMDIRSFMGVSKRKAIEESVVGKKRKVVSSKESTLSAFAPFISTSSSTGKGSLSATSTSTSASTPIPTSTSTSTSISSTEPKAQSTILAGTTIYINGSTLPQISDHKLKHLLVSHGAKISTFMARKTVSHIIIGQPSSISSGAGGGLSARKLQQEIERGGWKSVKVVGVDWYVLSLLFFFFVVDMVLG